MFFEALPQRRRTADVRLDRGDIRRWRRGGGAEDVLQEPDATDDRRGVHAIGGEGEDARLTEQPAAALVGELDLDKALRRGIARAVRLEVVAREAFHRFAEAGFRGLPVDAVVLGEGAVHEGVVGIEEIGDGAVGLQQAFEEET